MKKWWKQKWFWVACFLFEFLWMLVVFIARFFLFPEAPAVRSIFSVIAIALGILLGAILTSRVWKRRLETPILRMAYVMGGIVLGMFAWAFIIIPLDFVLNLPGGVPGGIILLLLLPVLMVIGAMIMDAIGKRRDYRPLMEERGNI